MRVFSLLISHENPFLKHVFDSYGILSIFYQQGLSVSFIKIRKSLHFETFYHHYLFYLGISTLTCSKLIFSQFCVTIAECVSKHTCETYV